MFQKLSPEKRDSTTDLPFVLNLRIEMSAQKYRVLDYAHPTSGELARLLLQHAGAEYEHDEADPSPDALYQAEQAAPFGVLPVLFVDGKVVAQGQGISRYLAREFGLCGSSSEESAACDMVMDGLGAMFARIRGANFAALEPQKQMSLVKQMLSDDVPRFLDQFERLLDHSPTGRHFVGEQLTWADLGVALTLAGMRLRRPSLLAGHPRLAAFLEEVGGREEVARFVDAELAPAAILRKNSV
ncbi:hypothetical protein JTE90_005197 [Oedothorax gibbosus]|uniref:glutathione transferase n=1 Tax=Oedothorax gibbosus TaxID=931172 RepID=A0AAV6UJK0_9ARAC|nr:hypothetical protein JTE90_005197 [Oedothorax gibbosus]